ncbi:NAD(P)/FAD-dependent oxidoreductase [Gordonia sp. ABSL11-1]|uniref:phytoene desaturase family protein n=1 Tax=Gordonia sp. ABSL11-1 TaxID=3053924 RepID=UPI002572C9EB|nr:NAD(P)/FAD-dependent oxidoreductase [Gordonia sp. ABSL11-1]MDL9946524.1 NAD(P)/FAD-dependent oxidoreductase [Gordonia sp. ABSL11-1]
METADAVVVGAGHHGLIAAARLADAGWDVVVLEAQSEVGGAVRSTEHTPGYITDVFSAFYPLAVASPGFDDLDLTSHGLRWSRAPLAFGHPNGPEDGHAAVVHPDVAATADQLASYDPRDGQAWLELVEQWHEIRSALLGLLFRPFPPIRSVIGLLRAVGTPAVLRLARFLVLPAGQMVRELFRSDQARLLILGNALHADIPLDAPGSGVMGYLLTMLAQDSGFPVPVGGSGQLSAALRRRCETAGARVVVDSPVERIEVTGGRATGVTARDGRRWRARRAVLANVSAPALYSRLLSPSDVPARLLTDLEAFEWDTPVVKINYALDSKIGWNSRNLAGAGTVHVGAGFADVTRATADIETGTIPEHPFLLFGQMTTADPTRSPDGTESAWSYSHLPRGLVDDRSAEILAERMDRVMEEYAPGFGASIVDRQVQTPTELQASDANLFGGAVNGGTAQLFQQLIFRPTPGLGGAVTPIDGLFLASAAAHPGGGVHGACGTNAARAALGSAGVRGLPRRYLTRKTLHHLMR